MRKLFRAAFYRTENKKMIRIELVIAVLLSAFIILNGYFQTNLTNAYIYKLVARFFGYSPLMGPFIAVFAAYLWGTDYEYGTLRNKLICGHTREEVYFSNLLLFLALLRLFNAVSLHRFLADCIHNAEKLWDVLRDLAMLAAGLFL